jgi:hypothetical protein
MATGGLTQQAERLEEALRSVEHLRSELAEIDARLARVEDALYPVDPNSGWGSNGASYHGGRHAVERASDASLPMTDPRPERASAYPATQPS